MTTSTPETNALLQELRQAEAALERVRKTIRDLDQPAAAKIRAALDPTDLEPEMRRQDVSEELIDLAMTGARPGCRDDAAFYLANAYPAIERQVRAKVAEEIERELDQDGDGSSWDGGMSNAARIARGEQP